VAATFSQRFSYKYAIDSSGIQLREVNSWALEPTMFRNHGWAEVAN